MRIGTNYGGYGYIGLSPMQQAAAAQTSDKNSQTIGGIGKPGEVYETPAMKRANCETCRNRKYQDGSDENVSFKAAAHISPEAAASRVRAHEGEHVANAYDKAFEEGGKVVQASVSIHMAVCPECGRTYVAGGLTRTKIMTPVDQENPYNKSQKELFGEATKGNDADYQV